MKKLVILSIFLVLSTSLLISQSRKYSLSSVSEAPNPMNVATIDTLHYMDGGGALYTATAGGYVAGTNGYGDLGKYQRFDISQSYFLTGFIALFMEKGVVGTADSINFVVKEVDTSGAPGTTLHSQMVTTDYLDTLNWTSFTVNPPLLVSDSFFIGFEWTVALDDSFGLVSDVNGNGDNANRSWEKFSDGSFFAMSSSWGLDIDLWIGAIIDDVIPVELKSFTANVDNGNINLSWITATETNNKGFEIQRKTDGDEYEVLAFTNGFGTTTEAQSYSYVDKNVSAGKYSYRLKQIDFDGSYEYSKNVEAEITAPIVFALHQNYPNPFNPATKINFSLASDSKVSLKIFNVLGEDVLTLINSDISAGSHEIDFNASNLNSGIYFYRIEAKGIDGSNFTSVKKMILTK